MLTARRAAVAIIAAGVLCDAFITVWPAAANTNITITGTIAFFDNATGASSPITDG